MKLKEGFNGERAIVLPKMIIDWMESDALTSALHITDMGYYPKAQSHYRERKEPINQYVLIYCVNGAGWYRVGGQEYQVVGGQYFILPAGLPHEYCADNTNPWTIYWIHFKGTLASCYVPGVSHPIDVKPDKDSRISDRLRLFEEIYNTLKAGYGNGNLRYVSSLFHSFLGSLQFMQYYRRAGGAPVDEDNVADAAIHYMKENMEKKVALDDVATFTGYSVSRFSLLFKQKTGHSPLAYFNLLKIQQACFLLDSTDMKINQICYKTGFDDAYYFSRLFSKIMGCSPREYRKSKKG